MQALALEETNIEPIEDTIQPHSEGLEKVLNGLDETFRKSIFGNEGGKTSEVCQKYVRGYSNKKRNRSKSNDSEDSKSNEHTKRKKIKKKKEEDSDEDNIEEQGGNFSDEVIKKLMINKKLEKMTVPELKDICRIRNITTKGLKKSDILEKLRIYFEDE